jgi:hypothetical protein
LEATPRLAAAARCVCEPGRLIRGEGRSGHDHVLLFVLPRGHDESERGQLADKVLDRPGTDFVQGDEG